MTWRAIGCLGFVTATLMAPEVSASGLLVPRDGSAPIHVQSHRVVAVVEDGLARTTLRQTFVNPHGRALEAIYLFPLPEQAALVDLVLESGGQRLEGFLAERRTARRAYNNIVRRNLDPALVEQIGREKFRLSVFPVLPDSPTVVELTWIEAVPMVRGEVRYVYPLAMKGDATSTEQDLTVTVNLRSSSTIRSVSANATDMAVRLVSDHEAQASLERSGAALNQDIVVTATMASVQPALGLHVYRPPGGDAYFAAVVTPPELTEADVLPRDVSLVLDISGSMKGARIKQAKAAARYLVANLRPTDRVNVLLFNDQLRRFAEEPLLATPETCKELGFFVDKVEAGGGTALGDAIVSACQVSRTPGRASLVVVLSDGHATIGLQKPDEIVPLVRAGAGRGLRVHTFGVGDGVDAMLLEAVATAGGGTTEVFRLEGEVESRLQRFLVRTEAPAITDLSLTVDGRPVDDLQPRPLPDLFLGEQLILTGRLPGNGPRQVVVRGMLGKGEVVLTETVDLGSSQVEVGTGPALARDLFAKKRLDYLQQAIRLRAGLTDEAYFAALDRGAYSTEDELVQAQIDVSLETGVQCAYTSFLALLPEDKRFLRPGDVTALDAAMARAAAKKRELAGLPPLPETDPSIATEDPVVSEEVLDSRLPTDSPFEGRSLNDVISLGGGAGGGFGGKYGRRGSGRGGGYASQKVVEAGTSWAVSHQAENGSWDCDGFTDQCHQEPCTGLGTETEDAGMTGLSLLSFLGAGNTMNAGRHKETVRKGLRYLQSRMDTQTGWIVDPSQPHHLDHHAPAALALIEGYYLSKTPILKGTAEQVTAAILKCRGASGGWTCGEHGSPIHDAWVTGWLLLTLLAADDAGLSPDPTAVVEGLDAMQEALERADDSDPLKPTVAAQVILLRILRGDFPASQVVRDLTAFLDQHPPASSSLKDPPSQSPIDLQRWFFESHARWQLGGHAWETWQKQILKVIVTSMQMDGPEQGSWDPAQVMNGERFGRVYSTALMTSCLEVYYRYDKFIGAR